MFARLLKRFVTDQEGVFAVIFGVMAIVLVALGGAAVDYVQVDQVKSRAQIALDAAALALQPEIFQTGKTTAQIKAELETTAQDLLDERISDSQVDVDVDLVDYDTDAGRLYIRAQLSVPTAFVALLGINELDFPISTQVTRKKLNIEVAYVLDNSGSMGSYSRMTNLKTAANCATNILFYGSCTPAVGATKNANTKIAVVPFNFFVNVGSSNSSASWIDSTGVSSIANDNFDDDDDDSTAYSGTVDRLDLFSQIGVSWAGCVEARPYPYSVNDTTPNLATPDTLFVPEFAPDEPGNRGSASSGFYNSYIEDSPSSCNVVVGTCNCSNTTETYWCGYPHYWCTRTVKTCSYVASNGSTQSCSCGSGIYTCDAIYTPTGLSNRQKQERLCKYDGANPASMNFDYGPNAGCPATSILPLTDNVTTLTSRVNAMASNGATNIHQGVIWGFRVLSPTEPFTEGKEYGTATSKVMIVMTDGENTYYSANNMNGSQVWGPYGYLWNGRVGTYGTDTSSTMQTKTDNLTLEACTSAKDAGITIYTIGLNPPNTATRTMLTSCASESSKAYFPSAASELNTVFATIAEQLAQLRIEK